MWCDGNHWDRATRNTQRNSSVFGGFLKFFFRTETSSREKQKMELWESLAADFKISVTLVEVLHHFIVLHCMYTDA